MYVFYTILASLVFFFILKWMKKRRYFTDLKRLDGKTVLITGKCVGQHIPLVSFVVDAVLVGFKFLIEVKILNNITIKLRLFQAGLQQ